jgi:hypothetical protein
VRPVVLIVGLFTVCLVAATTCQRTQIRVSKEAAVVTATRAADFRPERTQVRLVRQGLNGHPYWAVSLSIPNPDGKKGFSRVSVARVDANNGKLIAFTNNASEEGAQ